MERAHLQTLHGGVSLTMAKIREEFWIPKLRSIVKKVRKRCHGCKRFQVASLPAPPQGNLPKERSEGTIPFNIIGVDYAGPIIYKGKGKVEHKGYIILYTCSLTRGVHLEFLPNMNCDEFILSFKRYIAARGRPSKIISDNGKTFVAASKWIKRVQRSEKMQDYLAQHNIRWQFNLSRASWWGGMFERMVGIVKSALYKAIGAAKLTFKEMQEVLLDVQIVVNNRPLSYCEDDIQLPVLTPNTLIFGKANYVPEEQPSEIKDKDLRKRAKFLLRCKESLWKRWQSEYLRALRERHDATDPGRETKLKRGDIVMIKGEEKNRSKWRVGKVTGLIVGRDGVARGAKIQTAKSDIERPLQHLYPLELSCDLKEQTPVKLNAEAEAFRPVRRTAAVAAENIRGTLQYEEDEVL